MRRTVIGIADTFRRKHPADGMRSHTASAGEHRLPSSPDADARASTAGEVSSWVAGLTGRSEMCLGVAGTVRMKITLYAGPSDDGKPATAIITGAGSSCYVAAHSGGSIQIWIESLVRAAKDLDRGLDPCPERAAEQATGPLLTF